MTTAVAEPLLTITCGYGGSKHTHRMTRSEAVALHGQCPDLRAETPEPVSRNACDVSRETSAPAQVISPELPASPADVVLPIPMGTYTIETERGHRTFRAVYQRPDAAFAPGTTVLEYLHGRDNDHDYKGFAFVKLDAQGRVVLVPWKKYRGNNELVADAHYLLDHLHDEGVLLSKQCVRCGRTLTTPESIATGLGPECAKKGW